MRGENIGSGVSTTGTATLTLAAAPSGMGLIDWFIWATSINGFGSGPRRILRTSLDGLWVQPVRPPLSRAASLRRKVRAS